MYVNRPCNQVSPVATTVFGDIEIRPSVVQYRPIRDWAVLIPALAAGGVMGLVAARGIVRLLRH